jgi:type II secretory ATPase GspE/PulE/Tfp pilus assembly ATPase PilB-like protein
LEVIIAQRLVRKICESCRYSVQATLAEMKKKYGTAGSYLGGNKLTLYAGKGCDVCQHTGYRGRTAIFELINITPELKDLILKNPSTQEINNLARKQGSKSLFEDGIAKVKSGITTMDELLRVAQPPEK